MKSTRMRVWLVLLFLLGGMAAFADDLTEKIQSRQ